MRYSAVGISGSVSHEETDAASACHSFWQEVGRETGAKGSRFSGGLAQQTGVAQCLESQPEQQQLDFAAAVALTLAVRVGLLCQTTTNASTMAIAVFASRDVMP